MDHQQLLSRGFFPETLPLAFTAGDFARVSKDLKHADSAGLQRKWTSQASINVARANGMRRRMAIVNPFKMRFLAKTMEDKWAAIQSQLLKSTISISQPVPLAVSSTAERGKRYLGYNLPRGGRAGARSATLGGTRYTLVADVSNFYGSIYTHAIDWALHGKESAKASAGKGSATLGSTLDVLVRNGQHGQTKGIPVGPDASLVLSEIIMSSVDQELCRLLPRTRSRARRFVDDLEVGARTYTEAEDVLHQWESILAKFELSINPLKTRILEGALPPEPSWKIALRQHPIREDSTVKLSNDLMSIFSLAFEASSNAPDSAPVTYAIRRVADLKFSGGAWDDLQNLLLGAMTVEPSSMRRVYEVMARAVWRGLQPDLARFEEVLNDIVVYHAAREHGSEVTWALYLLHRLGLRLDVHGAAAVLAMQDNCSLILLRSLEDSNRVDGSPLSWSAVVSRVEDMSCPSSEDWLLGYEFARNGWANPRAFQSIPYWKELLDLDVAFFQEPGMLSARPSGPGTSTEKLDDQPGEEKGESAPHSGAESDSGQQGKGDAEGSASRGSAPCESQEGDETSSPVHTPRADASGTSAAADQEAGDDEDEEDEDDPDLDLVELLSFGAIDIY